MRITTQTAVIPLAVLSTLRDQLSTKYVVLSGRKKIKSIISERLLK
ncbi:MAG: hypothetical protein LBE12_16500 [Planctomycetaceae bacterium]|jgi:hypothetical protein|nr:hypothetical protein [Planctomycetaceae bacterium]